MLMSRDTYACLGEENDAEFSELGSFSLKGISHEMEVIQVCSTSLAAREFPKLDRNKLLEIAAKAEPVCELCSRPISCLYCKDKRTVKQKKARGSMMSRVSSTISSAVNSSLAGSPLIRLTLSHITLNPHHKTRRDC